MRHRTGARPCKGHEPYSDRASHGRGVPTQRVLPWRQGDNGDVQGYCRSQGRRVQSLDWRSAKKSAGARGRLCTRDSRRGGRLPARRIGHVGAEGARHHLGGGLRRHVRAPLPEVPVRFLLASEPRLQLVCRVLTAAAAGARRIRYDGCRARAHRPIPPTRVC